MHKLSFLKYQQSSQWTLNLSTKRRVLKPVNAQHYLIKPSRLPAEAAPKFCTVGGLYWLLFPLSPLPWLWPSVQMANGQRESLRPRHPMSYSWAPASRVTLHMKGQARAWARLPRLSSMTFLLYAVLPGPGVITVMAKRDGKTRLCCCFLPGCMRCVRSCLHWHGISDCAAAAHWLRRHILNIRSRWLSAFCTDSNSTPQQHSSRGDSTHSDVQLMRQYCDKQTTFNALFMKVAWRGQILWPILWICAQHLPIQSAHTQ